MEAAVSAYKCLCSKRRFTLRPRMNLRLCKTSLSLNTIDLTEKLTNFKQNNMAGVVQGHPFNSLKKLFIRNLEIQLFGKMKQIVLITFQHQTLVKLWLIYQVVDLCKFDFNFSAAIDRFTYTTCIGYQNVKLFDLKAISFAVGEMSACGSASLNTVLHVC